MSFEKKETFYQIPWKEIRRFDGTYDVLQAITESLDYEPNAHYVVEWFLRTHIRAELCLKRNDDAKQRTHEYLKVRKEMETLDAQIDEDDLDEQSENGSNDTLDLEGALTIEFSVGSTEESDMEEGST